MFQYVTSDVLPSSPGLKKYCLANPDFLLRAPAGGNGAGAAAGEKFSLIMHDLRMGGAWKRTGSGRLRETERLLKKYLAGQGTGTLSMLDIGASDGITTWEAVQSLRQGTGREVRAWLADLYLYLLRYRRGMVVEYRTGDGEPVMARIGRLGLRLSRPRREVKEMPDPLAQMYLGKESFRQAMTLDTRIPLIHPLAMTESAITAVELNCLERRAEFTGKLDVVRASNILNNGYFTPDQIRAAISHLHAYLRPDGLLVISRNNDVEGGEIERGTLWSRRDQHFERREDFGNGSEVASIVDDWRV
ncbi:MAG: hypothetical protein ACKV2V_06090 [Blastocatellia bacterium]